MSDSVTQNDINYMEAKSIFVQLLRSMPHLADKRPIDLPSLAERAATSKDPVLVRRGIKVQNLLTELDQAGVVDGHDNYKIMQDEVATEMVHLGNTKEKVVLETRSLEAVYKTICDHNNYLRSQLEQYKAYLQNVRQTTAKDNKDKGIGGVGVVSVNGKERKEKKAAVLGPYRFTHSQFEKEGIIMESNVPENRWVRFGAARRGASRIESGRVWSSLVESGRVWSILVESGLAAWGAMSGRVFDATAPKTPLLTALLTPPPQARQHLLQHHIPHARDIHHRPPLQGTGKTHPRDGSQD
jgi:Ras GTPase-activating-like protein IQGAP2/3